ncbi:hypothetical protein PPROV_000396400 [Pycnococcus provasolii]|uniref:Uncharacterized protein n=1 Tax=Pycnococcus provasolii TaxID=41880 RepID=A0A830HER6_9CHLO|nr:hypothetical protein PPROV_000396400 [Pycnococcus provasolii]
MSAADSDTEVSAVEEVQGDPPTEPMGDNLPYVDVGTGRTVKQISISNSGTCALLDNDKVKCWGMNGYGRLGYGDTTNRGNGPNEMGDNLPYVDLGTGRTVLAVAQGNGPDGGWRTCALLDNNKLKCWGQGYMLGYGDTTNRGDGPNEMGDNLPYVDLGSA